MNAIDNRPHRINLIGAHDHQLLLAGDQHHVAAEHFAQGAFSEKLLGEGVEVGDFAVVFGGKLIDRQETFIGIETEMPVGVIGKVPGVVLIADDKKLHKAHQGIAITIAGVVLVLDNLLHGAARADFQCLEFDLHHRYAVNEQDHVIAVVTAAGVDTQLADHLEMVFAPVLDIDQRVMQGRAIFAHETVGLAQDIGGGEDILADNFIQQAGKFAIGQLDLVEGFEFFAESFVQGHRGRGCLRGRRI